MSLKITIPEDLAALLGATDEERERRACEALALELYREGKISLRRMGELAGVGSDYWAADQLRVKHRLPVNYGLGDLESDRQSMHRLNEQ